MRRIAPVQEGVARAGRRPAWGGASSSHGHGLPGVLGVGGAGRARHSRSISGLTARGYLEGRAGPPLAVAPTSLPTPCVWGSEVLTFALA
jgi:hypothetical protein